MSTSTTARGEDGSLHASAGDRLVVRSLHGPVTGIEYDEPDGWLRVVRGPHELVANFSGERRLVPCTGDQVVVATHEGLTATDEGIELEPMSGALIR